MNPNLILSCLVGALGAAATLGYLWASDESAALCRLLDARDAQIKELDAALQGRNEELDALKQRGDIWLQFARRERLRKNQVGKLLAAATGTTWLADADTEADLLAAANIGPVTRPPSAPRPTVLRSNGEVELLLPANEWVSQSSVALLN